MMRIKILGTKRYMLYLTAIAILAFLVIKSLHFGDFKVFLEASKLEGAGETPYQKYAFIFILPALFYLSFFMVTTNSSLKTSVIKGRRIALTTLIIFAFVLMTLTTDGLI